MIETRLLYYFLAVAREQSITKAAESLHITQPTLSKQMMDLEAQLGKTLLVRGKKKVTLTEEGAYFRSSAQEVVDLLEKTEHAFLTEEEIISGDIFFGCGETFAMNFITEIFRRIQTDHPSIRFHIYSGDADAVFERIDKGLVDIGLFLGPLRHEKYDYIPLPLHDSFGLLMPAGCELAKKKALSLSDLQGLSLIFPDQTFNGQQNIQWFGSDYKSLNIIATYNLIFNATFMVSQGMGYAFCLDNLVNLQGNPGLTFRPFSPDLRVDVSLVTKKYQTFSPAVRLFLERLQEAVQEPLQKSLQEPSA